MRFPLGQKVSKTCNFDKIHVENFLGHHFRRQNRLRQRFTTSHRACNVVVLVRSVRDDSGLFRDYSEQFCYYSGPLRYYSRLARGYSGLFRSYSDLFRYYLGLFHDNAALFVTIWSMP